MRLKSDGVGGAELVDENVRRVSVVEKEAVVARVEGVVGSLHQPQQACDRLGRLTGTGATVKTLRVRLAGVSAPG